MIIELLCMCITILLKIFAI